MSRNPDWELRYLQQACSAAKVDGRAFTHQVTEGLRIGAEQYGDDCFMTRDNYVEALDEARDLAAYCMMEIQRLSHVPVKDPDALDTARQFLGQATILSAQVDSYVRGAKTSCVEGERKT